MRTVYIVLSRSTTLVARMVQLSTREKYSHTSFSLVKDCSVFYSFGRRNPKLMFPAGFIIEGVDKGFFVLHPNVPIAVYALPVTDEQFSLIRSRLHPFIANPKRYKYATKNLFFQRCGIPYRRETKYVCSAFVAYLLEGILDFGKDSSLVYPHEFEQMKLKRIYEGPVGEYTAFCKAKDGSQTRR